MRARSIAADIRAKRREFESDVARAGQSLRRHRERENGPEWTVAIEAMLVGIRRVLDTWNGEHRCWSREFDNPYFDPVCVCGKRALLHWPSEAHQLALAWCDLWTNDRDRLGGVDWVLRPGTTIERIA